MCGCLLGVIYGFFFSETQLGPFVDSEHPEIKKGAVDATFDEIFQIEVIRKVLKLGQYDSIEH